MIRTETLRMQVSGEFITDLARTWFWEEHRPMQTSIDLIAACISGGTPDEINTIATQILEGRKKFTGINEFELIDDNEKIRPLLDYIHTQERESIIRDIQIDMIGNFRKYVDIYATIKSNHIDALTNNGMPQSFQECKQYYTMEKTHYYADEYEDIMIKGKPLFETPTMGGLWLINRPELVYDACYGDKSLIGQNDFWKNLYEIIKDDPDMKDRNDRYLFSIRPKPSFEERMQALIRSEEKQSLPPEPEYLTPEWFQYQYETTKEITYHLKPDDMENWEGLIAPNGDFYSCEFGGHNTKAYYLCVMHPEWFDLTKEDITHSDTIRADNSLDILIEHGWCATRSVMQSDYVLPSYPKTPTKAQLNCILDAITKHNVHINTEELISYF